MTDFVKFDQFTAIRRDTIEAIKQHEGKVYVHTAAKFYEIQCGFEKAMKLWRGEKS